MELFNSSVLSIRKASYPRKCKYFITKPLYYFRSEETAKMVRAAIRPEGTNTASSPEVNPTSAASTATTTASEMEDVDAIKIVATPNQRPSGSNGGSIPASISSSSFAQVKHSLQAAIMPSPPPPYAVR